MYNFFKKYSSNKLIKSFFVIFFVLLLVFGISKFSQPEKISANQLEFLNSLIKLKQLKSFEVDFDINSSVLFKGEEQNSVEGSGVVVKGNGWFDITPQNLKIKLDLMSNFGSDNNSILFNVLSLDDVFYIKFKEKNNTMAFLKDFQDIWIRSDIEYFKENFLFNSSQNINSQMIREQQKELVEIIFNPNILKIEDMKEEVLLENGLELKKFSFVLDQKEINKTLFKLNSFFKGEIMKDNEFKVLIDEFKNVEFKDGAILIGKNDGILYGVSFSTFYQDPYFKDYFTSSSFEVNFKNFDSYNKIEEPSSYVELKTILDSLNLF